MTTKRGEQEHFEAALANESLQGAQEAVAHEVAAAEPEMPPLLAEPALEAGRVEVIKFEQNARSAMATLPMMPSMPVASGDGRLPAFVYPPVFGGAACRFPGLAFSDAKLPPVGFSKTPEVSTAEEAFYEDGLETTPNLAVAGEHSEEIAAAGEEPPAMDGFNFLHKVATPIKPNAPTLASQADVPTQPWLPVIRGAEISPGIFERAELENKAPEDEVGGPSARPISGWLVWSIAVVLSVIVASWVFFTYERRQTLSSVSIANSSPPPPSSEDMVVAAAKPAQSTSSIEDDMRLALAPSKPSSNRPTEVTQAAAPAEGVVPAGANNTLAKANEASSASDTSTKVAVRQLLPNEERVFLEGLEAARRYAQRDQFSRALRELNKIQAHYKKYPVRAAEFEFLYAVSLAFTEGDSKQTLKALQMLESLRNTYKANPDYWRATGFSNQVLGMDEAQPIAERRKFLRQAKQAYAESLRLGRNNPKYTQATSYIEHIERDLRELVDE